MAPTESPPPADRRPDDREQANRAQANSAQADPQPDQSQATRRRRRRPRSDRRRPDATSQPEHTQQAQQQLEQAARPERAQRPRRSERRNRTPAADPAQAAGGEPRAEQQQPGGEPRAEQQPRPGRDARRSARARRRGSRSESLPGDSAEERASRALWRDLAGAGPSRIGASAAARARDIDRPSEDDLAAAEARLVIVRRPAPPRRTQAPRDSS